MGSFDGLFERAKQNYPDVFSGNSGGSQTVSAAPQTVQRTVPQTVDFTGLAERAMRNFPEAFTTRKTSGNDLIDQWTRKYQGKGYNSLASSLLELEDGDEKDWLTAYADNVKRKEWQDLLKKKPEDWVQSSDYGLKAYEQDLENERHDRQVQNWLNREAEAALMDADPLYFQMVQQFREDTSYKEISDAWSEEQKRDFGYLYTQDKKKAEEYAIELNNQLKAQTKDTQRQAVQEKATSGFWKGAGQTAKAIGAGMMGIGDYAQDLAEYQARGRITERSDQLSPSEYSGAVISGVTEHLNTEWGGLDKSGWAALADRNAQYAKTGTVGDMSSLTDHVNKDGEGFGLGDMYGIGVSAATSMISAGALGSAGSLVQFFGSAAASAVDDARSRGASDEQALAYGAALGAAESLTELIPIDSLMNIGKAAELKGAMWSILKQSGEEFLGEGMNAILGNIADNFIMADKSNFYQLKQEYIDSGVSEQEAEKQAWRDLMQGIAYDAVTGAASGGISGSAMLGIQSGINRIKGRATSDSTDHSTEPIDSSTEADDNATEGAEKSTPGGVTEQPAAVGDKQSATETVSKMENIQQTDDLDSFAQQFGTQAEAVKRNYLEGQDLQEREAAYNLGRAAADNVNTGVDNVNAGVDNVNDSVDNANAVTTNEDTASAAEVAAIDTDEVTAAETGIVGSTVQISTGKDVEISRISSISKDGSMTLELSDGTTVDAGDIQHRSEGEAVLYEAVAAIGADAEVSNILVNNWKNDPGGVSAEQYTAGMIDAFNYGRYHVPQKEMSDNKSIQALTPVQRNSAYALGKSFGGQLVQTQEANARRAKAIAKAQSVIKASAQKKQDSTSKKKTTAKTTPASRVNFDRKGKKLNPVQESSLQVMEMLAQATGTKFHVYESYVKNGKRVYKDATGKEKAAPSGWYEDGTGEIYIDLNAGLTADGTMLYTTAHELTHFIREWSPAKFDTLAEVLFEQVYKEKDISVIGLIREQQAKALRTGREISFDEAYEEVVADSMESILTSGNVVDLMAQVKQRDQTLWEKIREWFKNLAEDIRKLVQAYSGHKPDSPEGRAVASMKDMLPVLESFYADALQEASANFQAAESRERVEQTGGRKYSYAGENARTADLDQLATAKAMQQEGVSNETIRQQTGWFMGRDGKWRFEIDDSNMRVDQHGDARGAVSYKWALEDLESARDELWGHADMETLNNVRAYNRAILSGDTAEENRLHDLLINGTHAHNFSLYAEARKHVKEMSQKFGGVLHSGGQLADYVQHDALYEAYPQLQAASFRFGWLPDGTRGQYNPDDNSIIISKEIADSPERTIIHEIQHAIQKAEGFASGSSPEYWETRQRSGDSIGVNDQKIDAQMKHAQEILNNLPEDVAAEFRDWYDLNSRDENKGMVLAQELSSGQYGAQFNDYFMTTWTLEDLVKYNYSRGSNDLYRNTAGEIEARDTANRWQAGLDAEGRKNTPPDLGDDKTVFTEGNVRSEQAIGRTADNKPFVIVERDILAGVDQSQWVKTVINNIRNRFPNGVTIGRNSIAINQRSRRELTYSEYMHKIKKEDPQLYSDKLRATDNLDEIIEATTNWISEGLKHERTDNIRDFARGNVLIRIGSNDYLAEVVVGTKANGSMLLYDILNLQKTQIADKKTDAGLTSESQNNSTDRQPTSIADSIRDSETEVNRKFSHRDPLQEKAAQALEMENQRLREDVKGLKDLVKLQGKLTGGKIMNPSSIEKAARVLKKNADAKGDTKELAQLLTDFYSYISGSPDLTWEGVKEAAQKAADWLWENRREEVDEYSAEILQDLRTRSISLSDSQKAEAAVTHDTFGNYRKSLFGSVKITKDGMSLDETWHELASLYPGVFDENMNANDMPAALADIVSRLKSSKNMAVAYDQDMLRQALIRDVYDSYWNVSTLHTVADVKQKEINALKGRHAQQMSDLRAKHRDKVAELRKERSDAVAAVRASERQKAKSRTEKALKKYQDNQELVAANRAERKGKTALRRQIRKTVFELEKLLNRGDKKKNVKSGMTSMVDSVLKLADALFMDEYTNRDMLRNGVGVELTDAEEKLFREAQQILQQAESGAAIEGMEFTSEVDAMNQLKKLDQKLSSKMAGLKDVFARERKRLYGTTVSDLLGKLADEYSRLSEAEDGAVRAAKDENVYAHLLQLQKDVGGTTVRDMTLNQMEAVADAFTMVLTTVRNANKLFGKNQKFTVETMTREVAAQMRSNGINTKDPPKLLKDIASKVNEMSWQNLRPVDAFRRTGSEKMMELFWGLVDGMAERGQMTREIRDYMVKARKDTRYSKFDFKKADTYTTVDGKKMRLTLGEKMSIYAYSKREAAFDHMTEGGFTYAKAQSYKDDKGVTRYHNNAGGTWRLSLEDLENICNSLAAEQKRYADTMQKFLTEFGQRGNTVSRALFGIDLFKEQNYFPLMSNHDYLNSVQTDLGATQTAASLKNSGFTKHTTPGANNPIVLKSFDDVCLEHLDKMMNYIALTLPLENLRKVYDNVSSATPETEPQSTKALIGAVYGEEAKQYFDQFLKDVNGTRGITGAKNPLANLFIKSKAAAVSANVSVVVQQISAVVRASAEISPVHLVNARGYGKGTTRGKKSYEEMMTYSGLANIKDMGGFDVGSNTGLNNYIGLEEAPRSAEKTWESFQDVFGMGAEFMDKVGWTMIWNAVKREVASRKQYTINSKEFYEACSDRFNEIVVKTQVFDSVLSRSGYMRSDRDSVKYLTSFMGEPTVTAGMVFNTHAEVLRALKTKKDVGYHIGKLVRTDAALIVTLLLNDMLKSIFYAARDDDEDESFWERWAKHFGDSLRGDLNPLNLLPVARDISNIWQGRTVERPDLALVSDLIAAGKKAAEALTDDEKREEMNAEDYVVLAEDLLGAVGNMAGVPIQNIWRDIESYLRLWKDMTDGIETVEMKEAFKRGWNGEEKTRLEGIYDALITGDTARLDALKATYKTDSSYECAVRKALRLHDPRIKEMANARYEGDYTRLEELSYQIEEEGVFDMTTIKAAYESERSAQAKERGIDLEEDSAAEHSEESTVFSMEEYYDAIRSGNTKGITTAYTALIKEKQQEYYLQREAEDSIASSVTSKVKGEYLDEDISRADAKSILTKYGGKTNAEAETEIKKWEFQMEYHYAWGSRDRCYRSGSISRSQLASAVMDIEDVSWSKAQEYVDFLELEMRNEKVDISAAEASSYFEHAKPNGISVDIYLSYRNKAASIQSDKDQNGKTISGSRKNKLLDVIHALPISQAQKDALYLAEGWAESKLNEAPWH